MSEVSELLAGLPLFAGCPRREVERVARFAHEERFEAGESLVQEGERGDRFYVLVEGSVAVEQGGAVVRTLGPGDFFGEIALIAHANRTASVRTTAPVRAVVLPARDFRAVIGRFPAVTDAVVTAIAARA